MSVQPFIFIGLGNPGAQYAMTRHNLGYLVVEAFASQLGWSLKEESQFNAKVAKGVVEQQAVHLLLPLTYMNLSGQAVRRYLDYFKIAVNQVLIIMDDIALPFGELKLRAMGTSGGHNGLKSIETSLGTSHYKRLRMGIGHPGEKMLASYVLESFSLIEQQSLSQFIGSGVSVMRRLLTESFTQVMNQVNTSVNQTLKKTKSPVIGLGE